MFIPNIFNMEQEADKIAFMKQYSFATIITANDNVPMATQLPFYIDDSNDNLLLCGHFAIANEQVKYIEANTSLVIFTEPHAYISPSHYDKKESVPTWDYIAVHAYGKATIVTDETTKAKALEQMITFYEPDYLEQWKHLPEKFKKGMMRGVVAFELQVSDLQGQQKLSQNKSVTERERIVRQLEKSSNTLEKDLAKYVRDTF